MRFIFLIVDMYIGLNCIYFNRDNNSIVEYRYKNVINNFYIID